jgi:sulfopyruvate decarboxylase subunit beta
MDRLAILEVLGRLRPGAPLVIGPGAANAPIATTADDPLTIYGMDMSYATPIALGIALHWPDRPVVAVAGDGDILCGPGVLTTIARYHPPRLIVLVLDNGAYLTTGTGLAPTATATGTDIELLGRAAGIERTCTLREVEPMQAALERAFAEPGPWLIVAKIDKTDRARIGAWPPLPVDVFESCLRFRRAALAQIG